MTDPWKTEKIISCILHLLELNSPSIREVAQVIGYIVSSLPAVKYGKCHYRTIENDKIAALKQANFDVTMCLSNSAVAELNWSLENLPTAFNVIHTPLVDCTLNSDASLTGWGACSNHSYKSYLANMLKCWLTILQQLQL